MTSNQVKKHGSIIEYGLFTPYFIGLETIAAVKRLRFALDSTLLANLRLSIKERGRKRLAAQDFRFSSLVLTASPSDIPSHP